jgi:hypothetical protein
MEKIYNNKFFPPLKIIHSFLFYFAKYAKLGCRRFLILFYLFNEDRLHPGEK